jgi:hypothetical protein
MPLVTSLKRAANHFGAYAAVQAMAPHWYMQAAANGQPSSFVKRANLTC